MLTIVIEGEELYDEKKNTFSSTETTVLELEHSLLSLSKWESRYQKPFLTAGVKTKDEIFGYMKAMVIDQKQDLDALYRCSSKVIDEIQAYIDSSQSATTFGVMPERRGPSEIITSELIYYWMINFTIPFECQTWHLNRLFALIKICNIKNSKPKKMSRHEIAMRNRELNEQRRAQLGTKG